MTLAAAPANMACRVDRVPEEDIDLLRFLVDSAIIPDREIKVTEAAPYLGVLRVSTERDSVSIGYNVARQIMVRPPMPD
jgi:Fe2+ transport system protein FeoA